MEDELQIINGLPHAPHFIFIRCGGALSDSDVIRHLGITKYGVKKPNHDWPAKLFITEDGQWKHVIDDWSYTQWHRSDLHKRVEHLARKWDVFTCSVGDSDDSHEYAYYHDSRLVRSLVVTAPTFFTTEIAENYGEPLGIEADIAGMQDQLERVLAIASSLGINTDYSQLDVRTYWGPQNFKR